MSPELRREVSRKNLTAPVISAVAAALAFVSMRASFLLLVLVPVLFLLPSRVPHRSAAPHPPHPGRRPAAEA